MTNEHTPAAQDAAELHEEEEIDTAGELHRMAAHHFAAAAEHHLAAATAYDDGDDETNARQAYLAYRHQLNAVQYAEIAVMDSETLDDMEEEEGDKTAGN